MDAQNQARWQQMSGQELLAEYKQSQDPELKKEIVLRYIYLIKNVALQLKGVYLSFAQVDDIISEGAILLMNAIDKFDLEKNVKFETYIAKRIRGMIIDMARRQDWAPRSVRKRMREIDAATNALYNELGRYPTDSEVAKQMGLSESKYREELERTSLCNVLSLDMLLDDQEQEGCEHPPRCNNVSYQPELYYQQQEMLEVLGESIQQLRENEQLVLSLYYQRSLQMKEIAQIMSISEPRVSQIHSNAIRKLRTRMTQYINDEL